MTPGNASAPQSVPCSPSQALHCRGQLLHPLAPGHPWSSTTRPDPALPLLQAGAEEDAAAAGAWEPERAGSAGPGLETDGSGGHRAQEPLSSTGCGEQEEDEEEEEEEGSCYSEEGEDGGNVYFYYTIGERWIDYLQRTEDGGLLRHVRPKVTAPGLGFTPKAGAGGWSWHMACGAVLGVGDLSASRHAAMAVPVWASFGQERVTPDRFDMSSPCR